MKRIVIGITGASGVIYGIRALEALRGRAETHLIVSAAAKQTIALETAWTLPQIEAMASVVHDEHNLAASVSSGSFRTDGMLVLPCSIKSLSAIANSYNETLIPRAADVTLKERRRLVLAVRETPLHAGHLRLMQQATESGAIIVPPVPAFYTRPTSLDDIIKQTVGKMLDLFDVEHELFPRWNGAEKR